MSEHGTTRPSNDLKQLATKRRHVESHLQKFKQITNEYPLLVEEPSSDYKTDYPNILYPIAGPIFCHIYGDMGIDTKYYAIEPELSQEDRELLLRIKRRLLQASGRFAAPQETSGYDDLIEELLAEVTTVVDERAGGTFDRLQRIWNWSDIQVTREKYENIRYHLNRDIVGFGPLEPVMRDTANEDIHVIGPSECHVDHSVFGLIETTVDFGTPQEFDQWIRNMGERMGDPVSDADPIIDSTLPDGSRINIIYSDDVSIKGSSLTIRQGEEVPLSVTKLTERNTLSPELTAYLWLCLENERTVFVVGESASGKTTTLNAITSFIPRDSKIFTAEDTAEVVPPHNTWQQLLTRDGSGDGGNRVELFDLVAAALRSRPDYIIVGEVRGAEGRMAFQAAQTGHPLLLTFHASDIISMIQRFTSEPINVPQTFMDNADVAVFQNRVKRGNDVLRRVTSVHEIEGYSKEMDGVITREVFAWDPVEDAIIFRGMNNSTVLEKQVATLLGYADTRKIYEDLRFRAEVIRAMIDEGIVGYHAVNESIDSYQRDGVAGLPFDMHEDL